MVKLLLEHGADPGSECLSWKEVTPEERTANHKKENPHQRFPKTFVAPYDPMTPMVMAQCSFPAAAELFSQVSIKDAEGHIFRCARASCNKKADKVCRGCRRAWYSSKAYQREDYATHKLVCGVATTSELTPFTIIYDGPASKLLRKRRVDGSSGGGGGSSSKKKKNHSPPVKSGACTVFKLQIPLTVATKETTDTIAAYEKNNKRFFDLRKQDNPDSFDNLVALIQNHGVMGAKAFFHVWGRDTKTIVDIDTSVMMPPRPW